MGFQIRFLMVGISVFLLSVPSALGQQTMSLFNSAEFKSTELGAFKKWASLRERHNADLKSQSETGNRGAGLTCRKTGNFKCVEDEWRTLVDEIRDKSSETQMRTINAYLNKAAYVTDIVNWNQDDYWATIRQFFNKDGDCEDYAIAKYFTLKELGFNPDKMRIVIVQDHNLNVAHAVLAVYQDNDIWILDNQISAVVKDDNIVHYTPLYSINEKAWWLHKNT